MTGNSFLWQEIYSCDRKSILVKGNLFLWQVIYSCDRKYNLVTGNIFFWQEISSYGRKSILYSYNWKFVLLKEFLWERKLLCHKCYSNDFQCIPLTLHHILVTWEIFFFLIQEFNTCYRNQTFHSCARNYIHVTEIYFLWMETFSVSFPPDLFLREFQQRFPVGS